MIRKYSVIQDSEKRVRLKQDKVLSKERMVCEDCLKTAEIFGSLIDTRKYAEEHVFVLCLTTIFELIAIVEVSKGGINSAMVPVRNVFQSAILCNAAQIIVIHNHPSGDCTPSKQDKMVTEKLEQAGLLLDVPLIDHLVMGDDSFYTCREHRKVYFSRRKL